MGSACSAAKTLPEPSAKEPIKTASFKLQLLGTTLLSDENSFYAPSTSCTAEREPGENHTQVHVRTRLSSHHNRLARFFMGPSVPKLKKFKRIKMIFSKCVQMLRRKLIKYILLLLL